MIWIVSYIKTLGFRTNIVETKEFTTRYQAFIFANKLTDKEFLGIKVEVRWLHE